MSTVDNIDRVVICAGADERFAIGLAVTLYSAVVNLASSPAAVYIIDMGLSERSKRTLARVLTSTHTDVRIEVVHPEVELLKDVPPNRRPSYARLLIPRFLPSGTHKAIYLDSDLVVESDLRALWNLDLGDKLLLAVQDYVLTMADAPAFRGNLERFGLRPEMPYFNSGVILINVPEWRQADVFGQVIANAPWTYSHLPFGDQDGLNAALAGRWGLLDQRWNVPVGSVSRFWGKLRPLLGEDMQEPAELLASAYILHYTTRKPWRINYNGPCYERFEHYLRQSGWFSPARFAAYAAVRRPLPVARRILLSRMSLNTKKRIWRVLARAFRLKWSGG